MSDSALAKAETPRRHPLSLLVIDDDPIHRLVLGKIGEKAGYVLTTAGSVEDAARKIAQSKFDCISLDLSLGSESGAQVLSSIAEHNRTALLIVISGAAAATREETLQLAKSLNLNVIEAPKPVDLIALRARLGDLSAAVKA
jgi:CheY-like chemotaxis protein